LIIRTTPQVAVSGINANYKKMILNKKWHVNLLNHPTPDIIASFFDSSVRLENCQKENTESLIVFSAIANKFIKYATKTIKLPSRKILTGHCIFNVIGKLQKSLCQY